MYDYLYENSQKGHTHKKTLNRKDERSFFNQIANQVFPEIHKKLRNEVDGMVTEADTIKSNLAKDMRGILYTADKNNFENTLHMSNLKQMQLNLSRKKDDYGHYITELTNALQRTKNQKHFDYDHYFRFRDKHEDMYYNNLINEEDLDLEVTTDSGFEQIYERNSFKLNCLYPKRMRKSDTNQDTLDALDKYINNYKTKNEAFFNYLHSK